MRIAELRLNAIFSPNAMRKNYENLNSLPQGGPKSEDDQLFKISARSKKKTKNKVDLPTFSRRPKTQNLAKRRDKSMQLLNPYSQG